MKVKVVRGPFIDYKEEVERNVGEEFICSKERFEQINYILNEKTGKGPWIEEIKQITKKNK